MATRTLPQGVRSRRRVGRPPIFAAVDRLPWRWRKRNPVLGFVVAIDVGMVAGRDKGGQDGGDVYGGAHSEAADEAADDFLGDDFAGEHVAESDAGHLQQQQEW